MAATERATATGIDALDWLGERVPVIGWTHFGRSIDDGTWTRAQTNARRTIDAHAHITTYEVHPKTPSLQ